MMATSPKSVGPNNLAATTFVAMPIAAPMYEAPAMGMVLRAIGFLNTRFAVDQPKVIAEMTIFAVDDSETIELVSIAVHAVRTAPRQQAGGARNEYHPSDMRVR